MNFVSPNFQSGRPCSIFFRRSRNRYELVEGAVGQVSGRMVASAAQVSHASFNTSSDFFNLHLTEVWVEQRDSGQIILKYNANMNGDAGLVGVSYQVNVKVLELETEIRGIVRWRPSQFQATRETDLLDIGASRSGETSLSIVGTVEGAPMIVGAFMQVPFLIRTPPLGVPLTVSVLARDGAFLIAGRLSTSIYGNQVAGPRPTTLTLAEPRRSDLIFELSELG